MSSFADVNFLQIRAYSEHPEVRKAASLLVKAYFADSVRRKDESLLLRDAKKLVASLWLHPGDMFRFTTKTAYLSGEHRKQVWLTNRVLKLFKLMKRIGWVNDAIPAIPPFASSRGDGKGMATIYARSATFSKLMRKLKAEDVDVNPDLPRLKVTLDTDDHPDLTKETTFPIDLALVTPNEYTKWVIGILEAQWELLRKQEIKRADGSKMPWADIFYHIAQTGKLLEGGRLYAPFCTYPKKERLGITIDNEPVGSLDLSQIHPTLLLAMEGLQSEAEVMGKDAPEDAYAMPEYPALTRSHHKVLINILFNAKSEDSAAKAFLNTHSWKDEITGELEIKTYKGRSKTKRKGKPVLSPNKKPEALRYIESYKKTHPAFTEAICSNQGLDLQSLDANIAIKTVGVLTQAGIPVLTVHDEFIVRQTDKRFAEITLSLVARSVLEHAYRGTWKEVKAKWETLEGKATLTLP